VANRPVRYRGSQGMVRSVHQAWRGSRSSLPAR